VAEAGSASAIRHLEVETVGELLPGAAQDLA